MSGGGRRTSAWLSSVRVENLEWTAGGDFCADGQFDLAEDDDFVNDEYYNPNEELQTTQADADTDTDADETHSNTPARNVCSLGVGDIDDDSGDIFVHERNDGSAAPSDAVAVDIERKASLSSERNLSISMGKHLTTT
eukprot:CAMPEP_0198282302 /NCGR_PEP_ID=MMETSP1449-20131203/2150_1 /TAXON_ID=420275 /ORGANISM="Attheya septentrionalis, Strain CCMP2084" /LENGTH=137 /DNA_ID=CAMNT_0043978511 /DNA_START=31 /DNA_END=440 /DNA_ORIENTATION=-